MPPSAFQNRNVGHAHLVHAREPAEAIRRPATQRPEEDGLGAVAGEERLAVLEHFERGAAAGRGRGTGGGRSGGRSRSRRCRRGSPRSAARTVSVTMSIWPRWASSAAAISAVSAGHRDAHRLDRDQGEDERVADVRRDVDQRGEHGPNLYRAAPMAIGIFTGSGTYALPGLRELGPAAGRDAVGRGARLARHVGGRRRAAHLAPRRRAIRGSPTTSRTARTSRR